MGFWDRNTLICDTTWKKFESQSFLWKIVSLTKGKANELVVDKNISWDYLMLGNFKEKFIDDENFLVSNDEIIELYKEIKFHSRESILKWLLEDNNHCPSNLSESDKHIFAFALIHDFYNENELYEINFKQWESKEVYIGVYGIVDVEDLKNMIDSINEDK